MGIAKYVIATTIALSGLACDVAPGSSLRSESEIRDSRPETRDPRPKTRDPDLERLASKRLIYTKHGRCRMECRQISEAEIHEVLREGRINRRKTRLNDQPCPSYAVEDRTQDGQKVRVVYADCEATTKVVTAIDLERQYRCDCR